MLQLYSEHYYLVDWRELVGSFDKGSARELKNSQELSSGLESQEKTTMSRVKIHRQALSIKVQGEEVYTRYSKATPKGSMN